MGLMKAIIEQPAQETCKWIYKNEEYCRWHSKINKLLWIRGKPGAGKSVLMKNIDTRRRRAALHDLEDETPQEKEDPSTIFLSFYFNARGAMMERSPLGLYLTLLHDLLSEDASAMCEFLPTFLRRESMSRNGKVAWHLPELVQAFHHLIEAPRTRTVTILVDALDECEHAEVRSIIQSLENSVDTAALSGGRLQICWSSRYYPNISLRSEHGMNLHLDRENQEDIELFVRRELLNGKDIVLRHLGLQIVKRAKGVFLWAVLVVQQLRRTNDEVESEENLSSLLISIPDKLDDLFDQIFRSSDFSEARIAGLTRILH